MRKPDLPFTTDGCSGGMSWFFNNILHQTAPWRDACIKHDKAYWFGGSFKDRQRADIQLAMDVTYNGYPIIAALMYYAVRIGGSPLWPFKWRWGYGHSDRAYVRSLYTQGTN